jgi:hypothetical protein
VNGQISARTLGGYASFPSESYLADTVATGDSFPQVKLTTETLCDTPVAAHRVLAELVHLFPGTALFLPCADQRTVVKIHIKVVIGNLPHLHLENQPTRQVEKAFFETFEAARTVSFGNEAPLIPPATADRFGREFFGFHALFARLVAEEVEPQRPVFKQLSHLFDQSIPDFWGIYNVIHEYHDTSRRRIMKSAAHSPCFPCLLVTNVRRDRRIGSANERSFSRMRGYPKLEVLEQPYIKMSVAIYGASAINRDYFQFPRRGAKLDPQTLKPRTTGHTNGKRVLCGIMPHFHPFFSRFFPSD